MLARDLFQLIKEPGQTKDKVLRILDLSEQVLDDFLYLIFESSFSYLQAQEEEKVKEERSEFVRANFDMEWRRLLISMNEEKIQHILSLNLERPCVSADETLEEIASQYYFFKYSKFSTAESIYSLEMKNFFNSIRMQEEAWYPLSPSSDVCLVNLGTLRPLNHIFENFNPAEGDRIIILENASQRIKELIKLLKDNPALDQMSPRFSIERSVFNNRLSFFFESPESLKEFVNYFVAKKQTLEVAEKVGPSYLVEKKHERKVSKEAGLSGPALYYEILKSFGVDNKGSDVLIPTSVFKEARVVANFRSYITPRKDLNTVISVKEGQVIISFKNKGFATNSWNTLLQAVQHKKSRVSSTSSCTMFAKKRKEPDSKPDEKLLPIKKRHCPSLGAS